MKKQTPAVVENFRPSASGRLPPFCPLQSASCLLRRASCLLPFAFCLLLFAFCLVSSAPAATWSRQQSGTMAWLHAIYFIDQNCGWVAGSSGTLLSTKDGGQTWRKLHPLGNDTLRDVYFANENVGWLLAERDPLKLKTIDEPRSYLLKTEDGGFSWRRIFLNGSTINPRLVRAVFADIEHGWVFGETGIVFATHDGGAHWLRQASPTKHLLLGGVFLDRWRGWLVGAGATMIQTSDGGLTWQSRLVRNSDNSRFTATSFVDDRLGWAVGTNGRVLSTIDGGRSWFAQRSNIDLDLFDVKFVDGVNGWVVGNEGTVLHTTNGGAHWALERTATNHTLDRLFFVDPNHGWAVGFGGIILSYGSSVPPQLR